MQVDLLLLNGGHTPFLEELQKESTIHIHSLGQSVYNPLYIFKLIPYLKKYEIIHVHLFPAMYFVAIAKLLSFSKTKLIFTEHSTSNRRLQNPVFRPLERIIYSFYSYVICISESVKIIMQSKVGSRNNIYKVINNGIQISRIDQAPGYERADFKFNKRDKLICMVSAFRQEKDHETVIHALQVLPDYYKLLLVGAGERMDSIKDLARSQGVAERVTFFGIRSDVYSLLKMCDVAVLSSHWEGFGLAAAEAMACGIPTIASNVDGLAQVVSGAGLLFEKGNASDLATKIVALQEKDLYLKIQEKCRERAKKYDLVTTVDELQKLYISIVQHP